MIARRNFSHPPRALDWSFPAIITGIVPPDPTIPPPPILNSYLYFWEPVFPNFEPHPTYIGVIVTHADGSSDTYNAIDLDWFGDLRGTSAVNMEEIFGYSPFLATDPVPNGTPVIMNVGYPPPETTPGHHAGGDTLIAGRPGIDPHHPGGPSDVLAFGNVWIWFTHWVDPHSVVCLPISPAPDPPGS